MRLVVIILLFVLPVVVVAQEEQPETERYNYFSFSYLIGNMSYFGDLKQGNSVFGNARIHWGQELQIEKRFQKVFGLNLTGSTGKLAGSEPSYLSAKNFESTTYGLSLNTRFYVTNMLFNGFHRAEPFLGIGFGFNSYNTSEDLMNSEGVIYHYWSDGTIRSEQESFEANFTADTLERDYIYESSSDRGKGSSLKIPISGGVNFRFSDRLHGTLNFTYNLILDDNLDLVNSGGSDAYLFTSVGLKLNMFKIVNKRYNIVAIDLPLDSTDTDKDGVIDLMDQCQGTPDTLKVDQKGCPVDTDKDGIADWRDLEKNTPKGIVVDEKGRDASKEYPDSDNSTNPKNELPIRKVNSDGTIRK